MTRRLRVLLIGLLASSAVLVGAIVLIWLAERAQGTGWAGLYGGIAFVVGLLLVRQGRL